jgi:hypothetical protein
MATPILVLLFAGSMVKNEIQRGWHDDVSINYTHIVKVHQDLVDYCEQQQYYDQQISTHFLMHFNLTNPIAGYLSSARSFPSSHYLESSQGPDEIIIFSTLEYDEQKHVSVQQNPNYQLAIRFERNKAWGEIWVLK